MMGIPFHADFLGNVVYCLSITSVVAMENILCLSGKISVVARFMIDSFSTWYFGDSGVR